MVELSPETIAITTADIPPETITAAELPPETILFEILPRLPAKTLVTLMCIHKEWKSFISTQKFVMMHLHHATNDESRNHRKLLIFNSLTFHTLDYETPGHGPTTPHSFPFEVYPYGTSILGTLHGLICVALQNTSDQFVFWNPLTGAYKMVSNPNCFKYYINIIGFYIDASNDYKLLHIVSKGGNKGAYIYSLRLDSWRKIQYFENVNHISKYLWSQATFNGQNLYFTVRRKKYDERGVQRYVIAFDVESEKFRKIEFPCVPEGCTCVCGSLVVLKGCIHLCIEYSKKTNVKWFKIKQQPVTIDTWRMDGGDKWIKVAAFPDTRFCNQFRWWPSCITRNGNPLAIADDANEACEVDVDDFVTNGGASLGGSDDVGSGWSYDAGSGWYDDVGLGLSDDAGSGWFDELDRVYFYTLRQAVYVETLVSPNP